MLTNEMPEKRSDPDSGPLALDHAAFLSDAQRMLKWRGSSGPAQAGPQTQAENSVVHSNVLFTAPLPDSIDYFQRDSIPQEVLTKYDSG